MLCFGIVIRGGVLECGFSICAGVPGPSGIIRVPAQSFSIEFYGQEFMVFSIVVFMAGPGASVFCFSIVF